MRRNHHKGRAELTSETTPSQKALRATVAFSLLLFLALCYTLRWARSENRLRQQTEARAAEQEAELANLQEQLNDLRHRPHEPPSEELLRLRATVSSLRRTLAEQPSKPTPNQLEDNRLSQPAGAWSDAGAATPAESLITLLHTWRNLAAERKEQVLPITPLWAEQGELLWVDIVPLDHNVIFPGSKSWVRARINGSGRESDYLIGFRYTQGLGWDPFAIAPLEN